VDDYLKELEATLTKVDMHESVEFKMASFGSGLRRERQDVVELYEYSSLEKLVHLAIKDESQLSKKTFSKNTHNDGYYQASWKNKINSHHDINQSNQQMTNDTSSMMEIKIKKRKKPKMKMLKRIFAHHPFFLKGLQGANLKN